MSINKELLKGAIEAIVLQCLHDDGEAYGYELVQRIAQQSENIFAFQEGTLYPLLYRMEDRGYVTSTRKIATSGKERRYYKITPAGKTFLKGRRKEFDTLFRALKTSLHFSSV
jgi:PadR family transcriptional regulator, regulatory protein PadR